ncbi:hypothetical protein [Plantactinospora sp. KLBMP9567]|uniref:hypothetical protein n=1 Tax=Plantactinospora sp. KLBMP9567 TaxID=3085900 RepID=UPI0029828BAD|nr:hypothetical protein [Plantactinospora sp. KLBMP9567]MDW5323272.1 hypothetical protein [Plantactinospora sp. KLBMP9567]
MPAVSISLRVLAGAIISVLTVSGCQTLDDAGRVIGRADLVNDLAARLDRSNELTYSADYQLPGGRNASISQSQDPLRAAYTYPGGKLTVTADATTACDTSTKKPTCTLTPPPPANAKPSVTIFADMNKRGLVTPPVVVGLLTAAALDPDATIRQYDTTVAGRHATCVEVDQLSDAPAAGFDACITSEGALGSFTGTVDGTELEVALSRYRDAVESSAFELPAGAGLIDRRTGAGQPPA